MDDFEDPSREELLVRARQLQREQHLHVPAANIKQEGGIKRERVELRCPWWTADRLD